MNKKISEKWLYRNVEIYSEWISTKRIPKHRINQVSGVLFTEDGKIMIIRSSESMEWSLPGGKPEKGETMEQALAREADEEASLEIRNLQVIGYAKTLIHKNDAGLRQGISYQLRYFGMISKINKIKPDPDNGILRPRKLVAPSQFAKCIRWGDVGKAMLKEACKEYALYKKRKF